MSTVATLEAHSFALPDVDEPLYEVANGLAVLPRAGAENSDFDEETFENSLHEVVDGVRLETVMSNKAVGVNTQLGTQLANHARAERVGRVWIEGMFLLEPAATRKRRPDVAFVSYDRWPRETPIPEGGAWQVAPDLAVEVISPTDLAESALAKVREYFEAGVRLVWVVYPELRVVHIFESFTTIRVVAADGVLEGGEVIPGFRLPMATLFEGLDG